MNNTVNLELIFQVKGIFKQDIQNCARRYIDPDVDYDNNDGGGSGSGGGGGGVDDDDNDNTES